MSTGFASLYTAKTIILISGELLGLFMPIFLYELFDNNIQKVVLYYGATSLIYVLIVARGTMFLNKFGFSRALKLSTLLGALYYTIIYFINDQNVHWLITCAIIILPIFRTCYWVPYHIDLAKFTDKSNRSKSISLIMATQQLLSIVVPLIAGLIITKYSYDVLFLLSIVLYLTSFIPYLTIPHTQEQFSWTYKETWQHFFSKRRRKSIIAFIASGAEETVGFIVWPIFIFIILEGNYLKVGAISTFIVSITVLLQLFAGKYLDSSGHRKTMLKYGSLLYSLGWIVKIFITTTFQIFLAGIYHKIINIFFRTSFDTITHDIAADEGHKVDEFTVLYEMATHIGNIIAYSFVIIISFFFGIKWIFLLAALSSIVLSLLQLKQETPENVSL